MTRREALDKAVKDLITTFGDRITEVKTETSAFRIPFRKIKIDNQFTIIVRLDESNDRFILHSFEVWYTDTGQYLGEMPSVKELKQALDSF